MRTLKYAHSFEVVPQLLPELEPLRKLAYNYRWAWHLETQELFRETEPDTWESCEHNPVQLVNGLNHDQQERLIEDEVYMAKLNACARDLDRYLTGETWFDHEFGAERDQTLIAYFCAEFGIHECLPIYSGGLGVLAGDHLKSASDLGVPLVGVGLLYKRGYFRQHLTPDGWQQERYPDYDFFRMPLSLVRGENHEPLRIKVELPDRDITCQIWCAEVGRVKLYLLDSNLLENEPNDQAITDTLYGGDEEMRIRQELILGIGGFKALRALGLKPTVCHMNEGHAAFLSLERLRVFIEDHGCDFKTARQCVVAGNVFTTHTPVPAGFDIFTRPILERYIAKSVSALDLSFDQFMRYGRLHPDLDEPFNMAILAMENSNFVNGVSKLHAQVSREMFADRWPHLPVDETPIEAVTNGVHTSTWLGAKMADLLDRHVDRNWQDDAGAKQLWRKAAESIPDRDLWEMRENARGNFVRFVRKHVSRQRRQRHLDPTLGARELLDPRVLTIGFARRFATYKRATLLFSDRERLKRILLNEQTPIQFVFAGKAHPRDDGGKKLIQDIERFIEAEGLRHRMVFLEDYDMGVARELVQGVDVWLNNPRRPMEASGTSGMKVSPNGGLNCSILDGWWAEGYDPKVGWAIGDSETSPDEGYQDWLDSQALYALLEHELAPKFYQRYEQGIPTLWLEMVRESLTHLAPQFSSLRMVREYTTRFYMPASRGYLRLSGDGLVRAKDALAWRERVRTNWVNVKIEGVRHSLATQAVLGAQGEVEARVRLGSLSPDEVEVQLLTGNVGSNRELHDIDLITMVHQGESDGVHTFRAQVTAALAGHRGTIVRVIPKHEDVRVAMELPLVVWEDAG